MNSTVFLIIWLTAPTPTAQFLSSYHSMKECVAVKARIEAANVEAKGRVSCMLVTAVSETTGESL